MARRGDYVPPAVRSHLMKLLSRSRRAISRTSRPATRTGGVTDGASRPAVEILVKTPTRPLKPAVFTTSYRRWVERLGDSVPLRWAPAAIGSTPAEIGEAIRERRLYVHVFRAQDGRVFRRVRLADLRRMNENPLLVRRPERAAA